MWDGCSDISVRLQAHKQSGRFRVNGLWQTKHCGSVPVAWSGNFWTDFDQTKYHVTIFLSNASFIDWIRTDIKSGKLDPDKFATLAIKTFCITEPVPQSAKSGIKYKSL